MPPMATVRGRVGRRCAPQRAVLDYRAGGVGVALAVRGGGHEVILSHPKFLVYMKHPYRCTYGGGK